MIDELGKYFRRAVEIRAHGITYRGMLMGADDDFLYLRAVTTWITIPLDSVTAVKLHEDRDWEIKAVPGEPRPAPEERDGKKRYAPADVKKVHDQEGSEKWPGGDEEVTDEKPEEGQEE